MDPNETKTTSPKHARPASAQDPIPEPVAHEHADEHNARGNYIFAVKVLGVLVAIIAVILLLQAFGVPISLKEWLPWL